MQAPVSRNAACPCGSGRRFKDCHGAIAGRSTPDENAVPLSAELRAALAAQRAGDLREAAARYAAALQIAPTDFDALHMLGVVQFQLGEFERALESIDRALELQPESAAARFNRTLVANALARRPAEAELVREANAWTQASIDDAHTVSDDSLRVIAFYLPQFHRIDENDAWWGEGFTEWTNVRKGAPQFAGHWQPHAAGELGYYDLTDAATREAQARLAREHGVDAFCYYYYWFGGKRLLERPLDAVLASGRPDFPFCVCWANENWTRRWDGLDREILIAQRYSADDARAFIEGLVPMFRDRRYVRVNGRPLLVVYKIAELPDVAGTVAIWRRVCRAAGVGEPYLAVVQRHALDDPSRFGVDASIEFPPIGHAAENIVSRLAGVDPAFRGAAFAYANLAADYLLRPRPSFRMFRGVTPMWDNTARRNAESMIVDGSTPELFGVWTKHALRQTRLRHTRDERLLFVNAWNEWAEGNHLEPDALHGRRYLESLRAARRLAAQAQPTRPAFADIERDTQRRIDDGEISVRRFGATRGAATVSVVVPAFNHARFIGHALESLAAQTRPPDEVIAVDDGSSDHSASVIADWARAAPFPVTLVQQPNAGANVALNRGMALAQGEVLALMNSDDAFAPERIERMVAALDAATAFAFSAVALIDDENRPAQGPYAHELMSRFAELPRLPGLLHALIRHNVAVSTGNFVFRRTLLGSVGGFAAFRACHDWDFLLAATYFTRMAVVDRPLYVYRLHAANTMSGATLAGRIEGEVVLARFFESLGVHPWLDDAARAELRAFAHTAGLGGYLAER